MPPRDMLVMPKKTAGLTSEEFARLRDELGIEEESGRDAGADATQCPFCGEPLPDAPSEPLRKMMAHWQSRKNAGRLLRATDTLMVCQQHRDERDVIPHGVARGWPLQLDLAALRKRILVPSARYLRVLEDRVRDPETSEWYKCARTRRSALGKGASASKHSIESFDTHQAGYYGERGWELFRDIVHSTFLSDPSTPSLDLRQAETQRRIHPLDAHAFTEQVLIPELACMLVQDDLGSATYEDAQRVLRDSSKFGIAVHSSDSAPRKLGKRPAPQQPTRKSARLHQPRISTFFGAHQ